MPEEQELKLSTSPACMFTHTHKHTYRKVHTALVTHKQSYTESTSHICGIIQPDTNWQHRETAVQGRSPAYFAVSILGATCPEGEECSECEAHRTQDFKQMCVRKSNNRFPKFKELTTSTTPQWGQFSAASETVSLPTADLQNLWVKHSARPLR